MSEFQTFFEQVGVERQINADTPEEAIRSFKHSCAVCCTKGAYVKCDKCAIAHAHNEVLACFQDVEEFLKSKLRVIAQNE